MRELSSKKTVPKAIKEVEQKTMQIADGVKTMVGKLDAVENALENGTLLREEDLLNGEW